MAPILDFVADFVVAGRASVAPPVAVRILQQIAAGAPAKEQQQQGPQQEADAAGKGSSVEASAAGERHAERERRFLAIMVGGGFSGERPPPEGATAAVLGLAQRAGFLAAQARVRAFAAMHSSHQNGAFV